METCIQFFQIIGMGLIHFGESKFERKSFATPAHQVWNPELQQEHQKHNAQNKSILLLNRV